MQLVNKVAIKYLCPSPISGGKEQKELEKCSLLVCLMFVSNINLKVSKIFVLTNFSSLCYQVECSVKCILFCQMRWGQFSEIVKLLNEMNSPPRDHWKFQHRKKRGAKITFGSVEKQSFGAGNQVTSVWRNQLIFKGVNGVTI